MKSICVFSGSSPGLRTEYREAAIQLGKELAKRQLRLIYGGANVGLMAVVANTVLAEGGQVTGAWTCLEDRRWVHTKLDTPIPPPLYADEQVIDFVRTCNKDMAPMTFNVGIYQNGIMAPESVEQLHRLNRGPRS